MSYCAYITNLKVESSPKFDRLNIGECFGKQVLVNKSVQDGELGVYFPTDGRLGMEFCEVNKLLRINDENGNNISGGYIDPNKRHVTTLKLKGVISDGMFLPLKSLETFCNINSLKAGDEITVLNDALICEKYIPNYSVTKKRNKQHGAKNRQFEQIVYPFFKRHSETPHLAFNFSRFNCGDNCVITNKLHGTSARTSYTVKKEFTISFEMLHNILTKLKLNKLLKLIGISTFDKPYIQSLSDIHDLLIRKKFQKILNVLNIKLFKESYEYITGSRNVVIKTFDDYRTFYENDKTFRQKWHDFFKGKLNKDETIYYEIVGWENTDKPIQFHNNLKIGDKKFIKQYGDETKYTYGCDPGCNDIYVYRITIVNDDGEITDYSWDKVKQRCNEIGVKYCPEYEQFTFTTKDDAIERVDKYLEGNDLIGKTHIREGVAVRITNQEGFVVFKEKSNTFKMLEGNSKAEGIIDMEEAESIIEESVDSVIE